ncbi:alpha-tectorin-like, partial [Mustelus asterias]
HHFYPFGTASGDTANPKIDDGGSPRIPISIGFPFFSTSYTSLYVNNNGVVSFEAAVPQYTPNPFPLADGRAFIAPFWGDVDNTIAGNITYQEIRNANLLQRATTDINKYAPELNFQAQWIFVATWDRVAFYGSQTSKVNSFQTVLITNGFQSFIILNYGDIQWTTGTASGGSAQTGLGGTAAQAGFNSGGSTHYFSIPGSQTSEIINIDSTSNVQQPGCWVFRTDMFSVLGGCIYNGRFIRQDDTFWTNSTCESKCTCVSNNSLACQAGACAPSELCLSSSFFYACKPISIQTCTIFGDPHYLTFDGKLFHFQGTCAYVLSELCQAESGLPPYRIEGKNENRGGRTVSWVRFVHLSVYGAEITLVNGATDHVLLNGSRFSVPLVIGGGQVRISTSGFTVNVRTDFGLDLSFDGLHHVTISLPANYQNATCGLCGNMNGDRSDEFQLPNGTVTGSQVEFGRSWKVPDGDLLCSDDCGDECDLCTQEKLALYGGHDYCGLMDKADGPFNVCRNALPPQDFIQSCTYDLCANEGLRLSLCQALGAYSDRCRTQGVPTITWRRSGLCELTCPSHSHYAACSTACPASCADTTAPLYCSRPCRESCECDGGYILSGAVCVPLSQCGCSSQGHYYSKGQTVILTDSCSRKCTCWNATMGMRCEDYSCSLHEDCRLVDGVRGCYPKESATCWAAGDPHYSTFDGRRFDFQGTCKYTLSKYCGVAGNLTMFNIEVENDHRSSSAVSWTRLVEIQVYGYQIQLSRGQTGKVQVNGEAFNLPVRLDSGKVGLSQSGSAALLQTDFGLSVSYDWNHYAVVSVPSIYWGSVCGLCGNLNGEAADDFLSPNGTALAAASAFGNSWKRPTSGAGCVDDGGPPIPTCSEAARRVYASETHCGVLSHAQGPFRQCHSVLRPTAYTANCVFDLCALAGIRQALCQAIESYAAQCQSSGITIEDWRSGTGCELPCPSHSHYAACSTACPASCADTTAPLYCSRPCRESCECDGGYILSGAVCVPLSQCGCSSQGHYYSKGQTVILTDSCSRKCTCWNATMGMRCEDYSCSLHEDCRLVDGVRGCYPKESATCWAAGDPHYSTFDGRRFDFQGTCKYTLSKSCGVAGNLTMFNIEVENDHRSSSAVSWTRLVEIQVYGYQIQLSRGQTGKVQVNGEAFNLPVRLDSGKVGLSQSGSAALLQTDFGLSVSYDWNHYAVVSVPSIYRGSVCGLCGNLNGEAADDFLSPNGTALAAASAFGNSWKRPTSGAGCVDDGGPPIPTCSEAARRVYASETHCGVLSHAQGPFRQCHSVLRPTAYTANCVFDLCALAGIRQALCQAIESYAAQCQSSGITIEDWRSGTGCAVQCPENSHFEVCGDPCQGNCVNVSLTPSCHLRCAEGCFCDRGYLRSGDSCVPSGQCGCYHNGVYLKEGEAMSAADCSSKCQCYARGKVRCVRTACGQTQQCTMRKGRRGCFSSHPTCTVTGDPHYLTFDGAVTHFQGTCDYDIAKVCGASSASWFRVTAENRHRHNNLVSFVLRVHVYFAGVHIAIDNGRGVSVNGTAVLMPHNIPTLARISQLDGFIVVSAVNNVEVLYNGRSTLLVRVGPEYANRLCGMCGNFNGDWTDDKVLPTGERARDDNTFGNSWRTEKSDPSCEDGDRSLEMECARAAEVQSLCSIILNKTGPFAACHWHLDPMNYYSSCVYDLCQYGTSNLMLCGAIEAYEKACKVDGVSVAPWHASRDCPLQHPCEEQSCRGNEWCGEHRGTYGCFCDDVSGGQDKNYDYRLKCNGNSSEISLSRCLLFNDGWHTRYFHLNDPSCIGHLTNGRLVFQFDTSRPFCGSNLKVNSTHFTHSNTIQASLTEDYGVVSRNRTIALVFSCVFPLTMNVSLFASDNVVQSVVHVALPEGEGTYEVVMIMYRDSQYQLPFAQTPVRLNVNDRVYIGIRVSGIDPNQFVTTLDNCWTTPVADPSSTTRWSLVSSQCPNTLSEVGVAESGVSLICRFSFAAFKFVGDVNQLYLHCQTRLCNFQTTQCSARCPARRSSQGGSPSDVLTVGPFTLEQPNTGAVIADDVSASSRNLPVSATSAACLLLVILLQ